jgi:hypothetical protein
MTMTTNGVGQVAVRSDSRSEIRRFLTLTLPRGATAVVNGIAVTHVGEGLYLVGGNRSMLDAACWTLAAQGSRLTQAEARQAKLARLAAYRATTVHTVHDEEPLG